MGLDRGCCLDPKWIEHRGRLRRWLAAVEEKMLQGREDVGEACRRR